MIVQPESSSSKGAKVAVSVAQLDVSLMFSVDLLVVPVQRDDIILVLVKQVVICVQVRALNLLRDRHRVTLAHLGLQLLVQACPLVRFVLLENFQTRLAS